MNLEMTEAGVDYMPSAGDSQFSNITFNNISGTSNATSGHATNVGRYYFGNTSSLLSGATAVGVYSADDFINNFLSTSGAVGNSSAHIMSHAYIGNANASLQGAYSEVIKRFDFFSIDSRVLNIVGMNNGGTTPIPPIFGSTYNSISAGKLDGGHSHGFTPANYPGPGRQKPDLVAAQNRTSWATGIIASAAAVLHAKAASSGNPDATHPDTLKAVMLAGATKARIPGWVQTPSQPLDTTYGAGELNIFHSYRMLEQPGSSTGNVLSRGWARNDVSSSNSRTYTFTTPNYDGMFTLSSALAWQRVVQETRRGFSFTYTYEDLANLKLELLDGNDTVIRSSDSNLDNVEHIWNTSLAPDSTYKLKVSSNDRTADFSLAWRINIQDGGQLAPSVSEGNVVIDLSKLLSGVTCYIQRSTNLTNWSLVGSITATGSTASWTDTNPPSGRAFYRAVYIEP